MTQEARQTPGASPPEPSRAYTREQIETLLREGLASGESAEVTPEFWERKRRELAMRRRERETR